MISFLLLVGQFLDFGGDVLDGGWIIYFKLIGGSHRKAGAFGLSPDYAPVLAVDIEADTEQGIIMVIADVSGGNIDICTGLRRSALFFVSKIGYGIVRLLIVVIAPDLNVVTDIHFLVSGKNDFASVSH